MERLALLAALAVAACGGETPSPETPATSADAPAASPGPAPPRATNVLEPDGWGPLKIGMAKAEVIAAVGDTSTPDAYVGPDAEACTEFHPLNAPAGLYVMIEQGKLTRLTATELSPVKDHKGFGVGDTAQSVKEAYGDRATVSAHKYQDAPAEYIAVWQGNHAGQPYVQDEAARGIVYEIDGTGHIGAIHAGGPSIQYVEGCA